MQNKCIKGMLLSLTCLTMLGSQLDVKRTNKGFFVKEAGVKHRVHAGMVDKDLRSLSSAKITALSQRGLIRVTKCDDGTYILRQQGNIKGGGPVAGVVAYWVTKSLCWAGVGVAAAAGAAAVTGAVVATGGAAGVVAGGAIGVGSGAAIGTATATGLAVGAGAVGATGAGLAVAGAGTAVVASTIALVPTAAVAAGTGAGALVATGATVGGAAGVVAGIESASLAAGTAFACIPFLP